MQRDEPLTGSGDLSKCITIFSTVEVALPGMKFAVLLNATAIGITLACGSTALACGGPLDVACNIGKTVEKAVQDTGKTIEKGAQDAGKTAEKTGQDLGHGSEKIWNQARTDLSNGLDRIDPRITQFGRDIDRWRLELQSSLFTGPALEQWIIQSRNDAIRNSKPVPLSVRQALVPQGWTTDALLDKVGYKIGDGGAFNLAHGALTYGDAAAITLIDVIVFRSAADAEDMATWAHEMHHVSQYQDWGVHSFAIQYMRSWNSVENPAYAIENEYRRTGGLKSVNSTSNTTPGTNSTQLQSPPSLPGPQQQATALAPKCYLGPQPTNFCWMQPGNFAYGSPCNCPTPTGIWPGLVGY